MSEPYSGAGRGTVIGARSGLTAAAKATGPSQLFSPFPSPVYIGITRWSEIEDFGAAAEALMPTDEAQAFPETVNMQAFVQIVPADGAPFVLEHYFNAPCQMIEATVHRAQPGQVNAYTPARDAFFARVAEQPGYIFHREFVMTDGFSGCAG